MTEKRSFSASLHRMSCVLRTDEVSGLSDAELIARFVERRDDVAFSLLVRRHGFVVLGVCRRVLRHEQDAEDAFQATFLILAQKAKTIWRSGEVGSWLYGVAFNVARKAKAKRHRRLCKESAAVEQMPHSRQSEPWNDLPEILDKELYGLADKYRLPRHLERDSFAAALFLLDVLPDEE
jgi:DNA-directed RNA polymerase specialized sigma24 family protein